MICVWARREYSTAVNVWEKGLTRAWSKGMDQGMDQRMDQGMEAD